MQRDYSLNRRKFVKTSLQLCVGFALSSPLSVLCGSVAHRPLSFYHTHTGERFALEFGDIGSGTSTLPELNTFLRDFRTGEEYAIDPDLFKTLFAIQQMSDHRGDIEIISGYRSPKTNNKLRSKSNGVAKKSLHMKGMALDIRFSALDSKSLRNIAVSVKNGGVGYYSKSNFVHIDTGRVRFW
jgi:uncharacterized protein YcbK (DUF882 family)